MIKLSTFRTFNQIDSAITEWMAKNGIGLLRVSLGIIFFWFGFLKFFPRLSPAQDLAAMTIERLSFGFITASISVPVLALWETAIGLGLIFNIYLRAVIFLLLLQMMGTISPLFLFPKLCFAYFPLVPTMEGQYIIKNLVLVSAGIVIGATIRGGKLVADPKRIRPKHKTKRSKKDRR